MTEADTIERLMQVTDTLLAGASVFFALISAYVAALHYFVGRASVLARIGAFSFMSFALAVLLVVMVGARTAQNGLIARLQQLEGSEGLTAAGEAFLHNATGVLSGWERVTLLGERLTIDGVVAAGLWAGFLLTYLALFIMTFAFRWRRGGEVRDQR